VGFPLAPRKVRARSPLLIGSARTPAAEHLATFLGHTERTYAAPLPKYVVDTFEHYLTCGDPSQGFLRCHCDHCGLDVLVAFSCKHRGPRARSPSLTRAP
jgi:hypothetical protein